MGETYQMKLDKEFLRHMIQEELGNLVEQEPPAEAPAKAPAAPSKDSALGAGGKMNTAKTYYTKFAAHQGVENLKALAQEGGISKLAVIEVLLTDIVGVDPAMLKQNLQLIKKIAAV